MYRGAPPTALRPRSSRASVPDGHRNRRRPGRSELDDQIRLRALQDLDPEQGGIGDTGQIRGLAALFGLPRIFLLSTPLRRGLGLCNGSSHHPAGCGHRILAGRTKGNPARPEPCSVATASTAGEIRMAKADREPFEEQLSPVLGRAVRELSDGLSQADSLAVVSNRGCTVRSFGRIDRSRLGTGIIAATARRRGT